MTKNETINKITQIIDEVKTAVLATVDKDGNARVRWMLPLFLPDNKAEFYSVSSPDFSKMNDLAFNPNVEWMIQSKELNEIINIKGKVNVIDNPALKARVMEQVAQHLHVFWKMADTSADFVVLETVIESVVYFKPMVPSKEYIDFEVE